MMYVCCISNQQRVKWSLLRVFPVDDSAINSISFITQQYGKWWRRSATATPRENTSRRIKSHYDRHLSIITTSTNTIDLVLVILSKWWRWIDVVLVILRKWWRRSAAATPRENTSRRIKSHHDRHLSIITTSTNSIDLVLLILSKWWRRSATARENTSRRIKSHHDRHLSIIITITN